MPLLKMSVLALGLTALAWRTSSFVRRYYPAACGLSGTDDAAHRLIRIMSLVLLAPLLAWVILLQVMSGDFEAFGARVDVWISTLRVLPLIVIVGIAAARWNVSIVLRSQRKWLAKAWSVVLAVSCLTLLYLGVVLFHLVGYSANY